MTYAISRVEAVILNGSGHSQFLELEGDIFCTPEDDEWLQSP